MHSVRHLPTLAGLLVSHAMQAARHVQVQIPLPVYPVSLTNIYLGPHVYHATSAASPARGLTQTNVLHAITDIFYQGPRVYHVLPLARLVLLQVQLARPVLTENISQEHLAFLVTFPALPVLQELALHA